MQDPLRAAINLMDKDIKDMDIKIHNQSIDTQRLEKAFVRMVDRNQKMIDELLGLIGLVDELNKRLERIENADRKTD